MTAPSSGLTSAQQHLVTHHDTLEEVNGFSSRRNTTSWRSKVASQLSSGYKEKTEQKLLTECTQLMQKVVSREIKLEPGQLKELDHNIELLKNDVVKRTGSDRDSQYNVAAVNRLYWGVHHLANNGSADDVTTQGGFYISDKALNDQKGLIGQLRQFPQRLTETQGQITQLEQRQKAFDAKGVLGGTEEEKAELKSDRDLLNKQLNTLRQEYINLRNDPRVKGLIDYEVQKLQQAPSPSGEKPNYEAQALENIAQQLDGIGELFKL